MAKRTETVKVDDAVYQITTLDTDVGIDLYEELLHIIGPALQSAIVDDQAQSVEQLGMTLLVSSIGSVPRGMLRRLKNLFAPTCKLGAVVGGKQLWVELNEGMIDQQFGAQMKHLTSWIVACLKVNFADFLDRSKSEGPAESSETTTPSA